MKKLSVKDHVTQMVREVLAPPMKAAGFRRTGRVFWRNNPETCQIVIIAMSRWGSRKESSFDVKLGVFWHRVEEILKNRSSGKMPPPEHLCTFRIDLQDAAHRTPRASWQVTQATNLAAIGRKVLQEIRRKGLPWLEYRSELTRTLEWKRYRRAEGNGTYSTPELG